MLFKTAKILNNKNAAKHHNLSQLRIQAVTARKPFLLDILTGSISSRIVKMMIRQTV